MSTPLTRTALAKMIDHSNGIADEYPISNTQCPMMKERLQKRIKNRE